MLMFLFSFNSVYAINETELLKLGYNQNITIETRDYFFLHSYDGVIINFTNPATLENIILTKSKSSPTTASYISDEFEVYLYRFPCEACEVTGAPVYDIFMDIRTKETPLIFNLKLNAYNSTNNQTQLFNINIQESNIEPKLFIYELDTISIVFILILILVCLILSLMFESPLKDFGSYSIVVLGFVLMFSSFILIVSIIIILLGFILVFKI